MWKYFKIYFHKRKFLNIFLISRQDPNEDTEWNDALRKKGIIPQKPKEKEITEAEIVSMLEQTIQEKHSKSREREYDSHTEYF